MSKFTYVVKDGEQQIKLWDLLKRRMGFSTRLLRKLKDSGGIRCGARVLRLNESFFPGTVISIDLPEETSYFEPEEIPISAVYEDDDLLVINKQPGIVVHPTKGHKEHTIANGLMKHMQDRGEQYKIRFINRLDMDTSGLLLIGKNSHCQDDFTRQAKEKRVVKRYLAVVYGLVDEDRGVIDLPIGKEGEDSPKRAVTADGSPSVTQYEVLQRFSSGNGFSLVRLTLETGRTHQIRVHMAYIGHPVAGDSLYGCEPDGGNLEIGRQALHACSLSFFHPVTGAPLQLEAPLPADMERMIRIFEKSI